MQCSWNQIRQTCCQWRDQSWMLHGLPVIARNESENVMSESKTGIIRSKSDYLVKQYQLKYKQHHYQRDKNRPRIVAKVDETKTKNKIPIQLDTYLGGVNESIVQFMSQQIDKNKKNK